MPDGSIIHNCEKREHAITYKEKHGTLLIALKSPFALAYAQLKCKGTSRGNDKYTIIICLKTDFHFFPFHLAFLKNNAAETKNNDHFCKTTTRQEDRQRREWCSVLSRAEHSLRFFVERFSPFDWWTLQ